MKTKVSLAKIGAVGALVMGLILGLGSKAPGLAAEATSPSQFYSGKTITIFVGASPGGSFDLLARVLARHMSKYIPGNPSIIVKNMPGAGYLVATNYVYSLAGDGLTIVATHGGVVNRNITGVEKGRFDPLKFEWLGQVGAGAVPRLFSVRPEIASNLEEFLAAQKKKTIYIGTAGPGTTLYEFAKFLKIAGLNVKLISYSSGSKVLAALVKKEVDAVSLTADTASTRYRRFYDKKVIVPIFFHGPRVPFPSDFAFKSEDIPTFDDLAKRLHLNDKLKKLNEYLINSSRLFRVYAVSPGTPADRVKILRRAFLKVWEEDPNARKEASRIVARLEAYSGEEIESIIRKLIKTPPNVLALYRKYFAPGGE